MDRRGGEMEREETEGWKGKGEEMWKDGEGESGLRER